MYIKTAKKTYQCRDYSPGTDTVTFTLTDAAPEALGATVELCTDDGFVMATHAVADWLRWEVQGNTLVLTNLPVPEPIPEPEPVPPVIDPLTETQLAVTELAQVVEDNNTANQLAIAELVGIILGG